VRESSVVNSTKTVWGNGEGESVVKAHRRKAGESRKRKGSWLVTNTVQPERIRPKGVGVGEGGGGGGGGGALADAEEKAGVRRKHR